MDSLDPSQSAKQIDHKTDYNARRLARFALIALTLVFCLLLALSRVRIVEIWIGQLEIHANNKLLGLQWDVQHQRPGMDIDSLGRDAPDPNRGVWDPPEFPSPNTLGAVSWWVACPVYFALAIALWILLRRRT